MTDIAVIILTKNEALHIGRCLQRLADLSPRQIFVVDSCSIDQTETIARAFQPVVSTWGGGMDFVVHEWPGNQGRQFNWALDHCPIRAKWVLRLDADEYLLPGGAEDILAALSTAADDVTSFSMIRQDRWMGLDIKHQSGNVVHRRLFRFGYGRCEERWMDEHIVTKGGRDVLLRAQFIDDNLGSFRDWLVKHDNYAIREAMMALDRELPFLEATSDAEPEDRIGMRKAKGVYYRMPMFWRALAYFAYRYFFRLGFLEGKRGFVWHFFQGLWYRCLVDFKIMEIKRVAAELSETGTPDATSVRRALKEKFGITA